MRVCNLPNPQPPTATGQHLRRRQGVLLLQAGGLRAGPGQQRAHRQPALHLNGACVRVRAHACAFACACACVCVCEAWWGVARWAWAAAPIFSLHSISKGVPLAHVLMGAYVLQKGRSNRLECITAAALNLCRCCSTPESFPTCARLRGCRVHRGVRAARRLHGGDGLPGRSQGPGACSWIWDMQPKDHGGYGWRGGCMEATGFPDAVQDQVRVHHHTAVVHGHV